MRPRVQRPLAAALVLCLAAPGARAAIFNDILPGARPMGMGMAYAAVADDPYGMYYNPAGLAGVNFTQMGASMGRMISPVGNVTLHNLHYVRPLPIRPGSTVGAGYMALRQDRAGDKDSFLLHYSDSVELPRLYLTRPLQFGGNFKFVQVEDKFGLALDGGVLVDDGKGLRGAMTVTDLATDLGVPDPAWTFAASYRWRDRVTLAGDLRIRPGLTQFFPGVEIDFLQRLLKVRAGKGLPLDGVSQVALGLGFDLSPLVIDAAMTVPWRGFNRPGGGFLMTMNWKFGAPPFHGRFVGAAARQAEDLSARILELEGRKRKLEAEAAAAETDKTANEGQARTLESRVRELQREAARLQAEADRAEYRKSHTRPAEVEPPRPPKPKPKPRPVEPAAKRHLVAPGDTLRSLAEKYYGDASLWEALYEANRDKVERGLPVEGTVLIVPPASRR